MNERDELPAREAAIDELEMQVRTRPGDQALLRRLGEAYRSRGMYAAAAECFEKVIASGARAPARYVDLGYVCCALGRYAQAVAVLKEGLRFAPDDFSLLSELGGACKHLGAYGEAVSYYLQALQADGTKTGVCRDLALVLCAQKDFAQARDILERALAVKPGDRLCLQALAEVRAMMPGVPGAAQPPAESAPASKGGRGGTDAPDGEGAASGDDAPGVPAITEDAAKDEELRRKLDIVYAHDGARAETVRKNRATARTEIFRKTVCAATPLNLTVYLTYACNLECIMCGSYRDGSRQLPYEALRKIEPWLATATKINWVGGEVFLVDYFREALERIGREYPHLQHVIMTNGLLIDRDWAQLLARLDVRLVYSIDAVVADTYEQIRKGARFASLCESLQTASRAYMQRYPGAYYPSAVTALAMRRNMYELALFPEFCKRYRIGYLRFGYLNSFAVPQEDLFLRQNDEELRQVREGVREAEKRCAAAGIGFDCAFETFLRADAARPGAAAPSPEKRQLRCYFPWTSLYIDCDGTVKLNCTCNVPVGNILHDPLEKIWNGPAIRRYRRGLMTGDVERLCAQECIAGVERGDLVKVWD